MPKWRDQGLTTLCVEVRARVRVCVRACVRASVRVCVRVYMFVHAYVCRCVRSCAHTCACVQAPCTHSSYAASFTTGEVPPPLVRFTMYADIFCRTTSPNCNISLHTRYHPLSITPTHRYRAHNGPSNSAFIISLNLC